METETRKLLAKDAVVILVAIAAVLAFYGVVVLVSTLTRTGFP